MLEICNPPPWKKLILPDSVATRVGMETHDPVGGCKDPEDHTTGVCPRAEELFPSPRTVVTLPTK